MVKLGKCTKVFLWSLSIAVVIIEVKNGFSILEFGDIGALFLAMVLNPFIIDLFCKKVIKQPMDYSSIGVMMIVFYGMPVAFIIASIGIKLLGWWQGEILKNDFVDLFKIVLYIIYLLVLFLFHNTKKTVRYMVFGWIYSISIFLGFLVKEDDVSLLKFISENEEYKDSFLTFFNAFLLPIKEAILTYIIFDTAFGEKENEKKISVNTDENTVKKVGKKGKIHCPQSSKNAYMPYGFDFRFEYKTYKNVGENHKIEYLAKRNLFYWVKMKIRKLLNWKSRYYRNFDTYSEWETYVINKASRSSPFLCVNSL